MKKTMKLFAVLCGVALALFAACAHDGGVNMGNGSNGGNSGNGSADGVRVSRRYEAGDVKLTFYDDGTFKYTDKDGTTWSGTYEMSANGKITGKIEGKTGDTSLEVDTSGGSPSVSVGGEELDLEFEDTTPEDDDINGASGVYAVGKIVTISNVKYLVIKNTEDKNTLGAQASYGYYPNARADLYRDHLIEQLTVSEPYVIVFNIETAEKTVGSTSTYDDEYRILRDGKTYHRIRYRWENRMTDYASKTTDELRRNYDPSCFVVDNYSADYGTDLSKKFFRTYRFDYGKDGKTIAYSDGNWRLTDDYKDYVYITATKKERNQYSITDRISDNARSYILRNPNDTDTGNGNSFFEFRIDFDDDGTTPSGYRLIANGKGTVQYTAGDYKNTLRIYSFEYSADNRNVYFSVDAGNGSYVAFDDLCERGEYKDDGKGGDSVTNTKVYAATLVTKNEGVGKYVKVSDTTTSVNGIIVPTLITFAVPFADENAPLGKFTTVTFVPKAKDNYVIYVPKEGSKSDYEFIDNYKSGYGIFGEYSTTRPAS